MPIKYISVKIYGGYRIDGIRLYDMDNNYIANQTWGSDFQEESTWRGQYAIPEGQTIIGFKCNVSDDVYSYINNLSFITGPII